MRKAKEVAKITASPLPDIEVGRDYMMGMVGNNNLVAIAKEK